MWAEYDPEAAAARHARAISVGVFGIVTESMVHLVETGRLDEAPEHVPALVDRGSSACLRASPVKPGR